MSAITIIAICVYVIGLLLANVVWLLMAEAIDRKKPELRIYELFGFRRLKSFGGYRDYRDACPNGKLHIYQLVCLAVAMAGLITLVIVGLIGLASPGIE